MNIELLSVPRARRWWLLRKGMETNSFPDALLLAQAAEDFLLGKSTSKIAVISASETHVALKEPLANDVAAPPAVLAQVGSAAANRQAEASNVVEASSSGPDKDAVDLAGPVDDAVSTGSTPLPAPDEVVRFLRQNDDVVISAGPGMYLVNGRFRERGDELVARANRIRVRRNERPFVFFPAPEHVAGKFNGSAVRVEHP